MRLAPILTLALSLAMFAGAAGAKTGDLPGGNGAQSGPGSHMPRDPVQRFVDNNIAETLYHELGHALIDVLDLPIYGPEEFAVDRFAVVMMNRLEDEATLRAMTRDVAKAYDIGAIKERTANAQALWDVHGPDRQRYYNLVCLMYGANPQGREALAADLDLPDERARSCEHEYAQAAESWGAVLDDVAAGAPGDSLKMDWILDASSPVTEFVAAQVDRLNAMMALPQDVSVSVISCDEPNAFYDSGAHEIIICTELGEALAKLVH